MAGSPRIRLIGLGTVLPSLAVPQAEALKFILRRFPPGKTAQRLHEKIFSHPSVRTRRFALKNMESLAHENPDQTARRFEREAPALAARALVKALNQASLLPSHLDFLAVTTCTGSLCPGVAAHVAGKLRLSPRIRLQELVGMGCGAALPALESAVGFLAAHPGGTAAVACVEMGSAAFFPGDEPGLIVSNALFGDGAAAAVLRRKGKGPAVGPFSSVLVPAWREGLRFKTENGRLKNVLTPEVPRQSAEALARVLKTLAAAPAGLRHWALHPGGAKVMDAVQEKFKLSTRALAPARAVMEGVGNLSSPSCLFVLENILRRRAPRPGDTGVLAAFGAGFSAHAALLEF